MTLPGGFCGFNREGSRLGVHMGGNKIALADVAPGREYRALPTPAVGQRVFHHDGSISQDGRWLAVGEETGVRLWDLTLGQEREFLPTGFTRGVAFHPKDDALFTSGPAGLHRWPVHQGAETLRIGPPRRLPMTGDFQRVRLDAAGRFLAVASYAGGHVVNLEGPPETIPLLEHKAANQVTVSPNGRWIATGTHNGFGIKVWDAKSGKFILDVLPDARTSFALFSPDGRWLTTGTDDEICLWEVGSWKLARRFASVGHQMAFTRDGQILALPTARDVVQLVDTATGRRFAQLQAPGASSLVGFSADGSQLLVRTARFPLVRVWDLRLIGAQLKEIGLAWDPAPFASSGASEPNKPVQLQVDLGELGYEVYFQQARANVVLKEWDKAVANYSKAIESKPNSPVACNNLSLLLSTCPEPRIRDPQRAIEIAKKAVGMAPQQGVYWRTLGIAHYRAEDGRPLAGRWTNRSTSVFTPARTSSFWPWPADSWAIRSRRASGMTRLSCGRKSTARKIKRYAVFGRKLPRC